MKKTLIAFFTILLALGCFGQALTLRDPAMLIWGKAASVVGGGNSPSVVGGGTTPTRPLALTNDLLAYYSFNNTNSLGHDDTGNGYNMTQTNGTIIDFTGVNSNAVSMANPGTFNYLAIPDTPAFRIDGSSSFTIAGWFLIPSGSSSGIMLAKDANDYELDWATGGTVTFKLYNVAGGSTSVSTTGVTAGGGWFYIVMGYDLGAGKISISVNNGTPVSATFTGTPGSQISNQFFIIGYTLSPSKYEYDELGLWNRALSGSDLSSLYNGGAGNPYPFTGITGITPISQWKLNDGSGTTAVNAITTSYNGTLSGSTLPSWTTGEDSVAGHALAFNGTANQVVSFSSISAGTTFTLSLWVKHTAFTDIGPSLIVNSANSAGLYYRSDTSSVTFFDGTSFHDIAWTLPTGTWFHLAFVCSSGTGTFYLNGTALTGSISLTGSYSFDTFGSRSADTLDASLDDIRIYSTALTSGQVSTIYSGGAQ